MFIKNKGIYLAAVFTFLVGCTSNLVPPSLEQGIPESSKVKAISLLKESMEAQGYGNIIEQKAYEFTFTDTWQGFMGTMGKLWPQNKSRLKLTLPIYKFEGHIEYLDGEEKGFQASIINDNYSVLDTNNQYRAMEEHDKKVVFGIEAYKFFGEIAPSMLTCDFLGYVGEEEYRGQKYDVVFGTWKTLEANDETDHFLVYINKETKLIDRTTYTIRENYMAMPGDGMLYGNLVYEDYRNIEGLMVAHKQYIFDFDVEDDFEDYLHFIEIEDFKFIDIEKTPFK